MKAPKRPVPNSMRVQLSRLFGESSREAKARERTDGDWRRTLRRVLSEIGAYLDGNVQTDGMHELMILTCLAAAEHSLKQEDFWPGYTEALTRLVLVLLGDYPDHRKRAGGRRRPDHHHLNTARSLAYTRSSHQQLTALLQAGLFVGLQLSKNPRDALFEYRRLRGPKASYRQFIRWYKATYSDDYAKVF